MTAPKLTIETTPGVPPSYRIVGWEELDLYARRMNPTWQAVTERCRITCLTDFERLKILSAAMLEQNEKLMAIALKYAERFGVIE